MERLNFYQKIALEVVHGLKAILLLQNICEDDLINEFESRFRKIDVDDVQINDVLRTSASCRLEDGIIISRNELGHISTKFDN